MQRHKRLQVLVKKLLWFPIPIPLMNSGLNCLTIRNLVQSPLSEGLLTEIIIEVEVSKANLSVADVARARESNANCQLRNKLLVLPHSQTYLVVALWA